MKIVTVQQMRAIESRSESAGVSTDALMANAGLAVAQRVRHHWSPVTGVPMVILVGTGNNGADGLVAARHLQRWGARVAVFVCGERRSPDPWLDMVMDTGIPVASVSENNGLSSLSEALSRCRLVVDAILGTGRARPIAGTIAVVLDALRLSVATNPAIRLLALDVPTGLDADTGSADPACVPADVTVALGYAKTGHYAQSAADYVGLLEVVDIGLPPDVDADVDLEVASAHWAGRLLPHRPSHAHKGTFGRTMVVAGSLHYLGAAYLAAAAATRVGSGLVTIAIPESLQAAVAAHAVEPTFLPLPESAPGIVSPDAAELVLDSLPGYNSLLVGCGLGQAEATRRFTERLLLTDAPRPPLVIDADGLNTLAWTESWWDGLGTNAVLTPHPGEMARLVSTTEDQDRVALATSSAKNWGKVVVLKGAHTVVAFPGGGAVLSPFANPGLATAGTGDVLAGVIAGLVSQGLSLPDAAALGVFLHGAAGERVRSKLGDTGMVASDLLVELPQAIRALSTTNPASARLPG
jgi:NAD(P)H-hydrate epimerase